jgi:hypothetical protein
MARLSRSVGPSDSERIADLRVSSEAVRPARDGHCHVKRFPKKMFKDVENGLAAPSQERMRPPWPYNTKEIHDGDPADGQCPDRCRRP